MLSWVCFALLHPERGIALLDVAPEKTPDAVDRLRRGLAAAKFQKTFAGSLPIVYRRLAQEDLLHLGDIVGAAFAEEQAIGLHGEHRWIGLACRILGGARVSDFACPDSIGQESSLFVLPPKVAERRPMVRSSKLRAPNLRALGYFWLAVLATITGGAAFLQYVFVPPLQADRGGGASWSRASGPDSPAGPAKLNASFALPAEPQTDAAPPATASIDQASAVFIERQRSPGRVSLDAPSVARLDAPADFPHDGPVTASAVSPKSLVMEHAPASIEAAASRSLGAVSPAPPTALAEMMVRRADTLLQRGDVSAARLLYDRAAAAGSGHAATAMGKTFDAAFLAGIGVVGLSADPAQAATWYRRGLGLGDEEARTRLQALPSTTSRASRAQQGRP